MSYIQILNVLESKLETPLHSDHGTATPLHGIYFLELN